jgi:hypothetical protein
MKRGGGKGGGAGSDRALGIGIEPLEEKDGGDVRADVREPEFEYRRSKTGFGSYTRIEGGEVKRGMSMPG